MSSRRPSPERQEAVQRRLALLRAEMDATGRRPADRSSSAPPPAWSEVRPTPPAGTPAGAALVEHPDPERDGPLWARVPVPGRHAARRPGARARDLLDASLPGALRGRVRLGPAQLTVVALVVAVGLAVTCWWLVRGQPDELRAPTIEPGAVALTSAAPVADASPVSAPAGAPADADSTTVASVPVQPGTPGSGPVTVDVAGKVRRPGIVVLDAGARVVDAIDAAGGARRGVDLTPLNLARLLVDGEQVLVGAAAGAGGAAVPPGPGTASSGAVPGPGALVNLNSATEPQLEELPEVGPVTAASILTWRDQHGRFTSVDELLEVDGIGDATLAKLTPYVTV